MSPSKLNKKPMQKSFLTVEGALEEIVSIIRGTGLASWRAKVSNQLPSRFKIANRA